MNLPTCATSGVPGESVINYEKNVTSFDSAFGLFSLHVVAEQRILVADIEFAIGEDGMCPGRLFGAIGLFEATALKVLLAVRFNEQDRAGLGAVVNPAVGESYRTFADAAFVGILFVPDDVASLEVQTNQIAAAVAAVGAVQAAVEDQHAAVVIFHVFGKPYFVGFDAAFAILAQLHQPTAGTVGRGGEHQTILIEGCRTVYSGLVGWPIIPPEQFPVGRRDPNECLRGELHILSLAFEVDRDGRRVRRARFPEAGTAATTAPVWTVGAAAGRFGHFGLPEQLAGQLVQGNDRRLLATGSAYYLVAVNERGFVVSPGGDTPGKIIRQVAAPDELAIVGLQASQLAALAEDIEPFSIDGWGAAGPLFSLRHSLRRRGCTPPAQNSLPARLGKGQKNFIVATFVYAVDAPGGNGGPAV